MTQDELNMQAVVNLRHLASEIERGALTVTRISVEVGAFTLGYEPAADVEPLLPCGHPQSAAIDATDHDDLARGVYSWVCKECGYEFETEAKQGGENDG